MHYPYPFKYYDGYFKLDAWIDQSWNFQKHVTALDNMIIEIAGPTVDGYYWLDGIDLPRPLIFTNIDKNRSAFEINNKRDKVISEVVDVRRMPWQDRSVSMLLCSCLSIVSERKYMAYIYSDKKLPKKLQDEWSNRVAEANHLTECISLGVSKLEDADPDMLRLSFIREAVRVLADDGIIVAEGISGHEITIMQRQGLVIRLLKGESGIDKTGIKDSQLSFSVVVSRQ